MALKTFKPITPGQRGLVLVDRSELYKGKPVKALTEGLTKTGGRNNYGRITAYHRGGGHKRAYRKIDFRRAEPDRFHRSDRVRRRRAGLYSGAAASGRGRYRDGFRRAA